MMQKSTMRKIISIVFSFLISMLLFLTICLIVVRITVLNTDYMLDKLGSSNYYHQLSNEIEEQYAYISASSGIEESAFDGMVDTALLKQHVNSVFENIYKGSTEKVNTSAVSKDLYNKFLGYAEKNGYTVDDATSEALQYLADECQAVYDTYVNIPYINTISPFFVKMVKPVNITILALSAVIILMAVIIFVINRWRHRAVRAYIYALSGSFLMVLVLPLAVFLSGKINHIAITSKALYGLTVDFVEGILAMFFIISILLLVFVLVLLLVYQKLKSKVD